LLAASAANSPSESRHFSFECREAAERAEAYLSEHGIATSEKTGSEDISITGRDLEPITAGSLARGPKPKPWTDAQGNEINDFKVYWTYADRKTGKNLPFGIWRIRMEHYVPWGEIRLASEGEGCNVGIQLRFLTSGAKVIAILPVDSAWDYQSNGRLERGYLDAISAALEKRTASLPKATER
jgi:hypothetical protein